MNRKTPIHRHAPVAVMLLALGAAASLVAAPPVVAGGFGAVPSLGGAGLSSNHPVLRAQMPEPPGAGLIAAVLGVGLAMPLVARPKRKTPAAHEAAGVGTADAA